MTKDEEAAVQVQFAMGLPVTIRYPADRNGAVCEEVWQRQPSGVVTVRGRWVWVGSGSGMGWSMSGSPTYFRRLGQSNHIAWGYPVDLLLPEGHEP